MFKNLVHIPADSIINRDMVLCATINAEHFYSMVKKHKIAYQNSYGSMAYRLLDGQYDDRVHIEVSPIEAGHLAVVASTELGKMFLMLDEVKTFAVSMVEVPV